MQSQVFSSRIAVVGMGCWYPGAKNLQQLWENVLARRRQFRSLPDKRLPLADYYDPDPSVPDKTYGKRAAVIDGFEFDWSNKRIPKTVVETADIAHWLALEVAIKALEDAGYTRKDVPTERTGVLLGNSLTGEQTRSNNMRLRWPFVHRALSAAAQMRGLPESVTNDLAATMQSYYKSVFSPFTEDTLSGNLSNTIAGRICNFFDFHGGGYTVDGACSSSLIAVANAASALACGDLDMALAGGVDISLDTFELVGFSKTGALTSQDMAVYDKKASGFIPGEGSGFVVLKRLEDARASNDYIYAILNGWGISSDGKGGLTAPSAKGQSIAIRRAYERANYGLKDVTFVEGHGTGTPVGDRAEIEGIVQALEPDAQTSNRNCGITSLKTLVGHTKAAAGIGGFIKAVMAVNQRIVPPLAGCKDPNELFETVAKPLYPVLHGQVYDVEKTLRAGVSAMGFGGINCHVTISSADAPSPKLRSKIDEAALLVSFQETELIILSGESPAAVIEQVRTLLPQSEGLTEGELTDFAAQLSTQVDQTQAIRVALVVRSPEDLISTFNQLISLLEGRSLPEGTTIQIPHQGIWIGHQVAKTRIGFLFPGQGSQRLNMARVLVKRYRWARELVEQADEWLSEIGAETVSEIIYKSTERVETPAQLESWKTALARTEISQPAICLASLLWIRYLAELGIEPAAVGGHSLGELTAFYAAGAFDEKTLLCLAAVRGQAMAASEEGSGGVMASLTCSRERAATLLEKVNGYVVIANINSPRQTVISGERFSVLRVVELATTEGIDARLLPVSNGFHSKLVSEAAEYLREYEHIPEVLAEPSVEIFSCIDPHPPVAGINLREHFARVVLSQVNFITLTEAISQKCDLLLEVGPARVLSGLVSDISDSQGVACFPIEAKVGEDRALNVALAEVFIRGSHINWSALYQGRLVHPFVPAAERVFIDNPVERPFQLTDDASLSAPLPPTAQPEKASGLVDGSTVKETLVNYLEQRGDFLVKVIQADFQNLPNEQKTHQTEMPPSVIPGLNSHIMNGHIMNGHIMNGHIMNGHVQSQSVESRSVETYSVEPNQALPADTSPNLEQKGDRKTVEALLIRLISKQTGYEPESISSDLRLLDDLNLDSIKAGEVIAEAAKQCGIAGQIDPTTLANATLTEISAAIHERMSLTESLSAAKPEASPKTTDITGEIVRCLKTLIVAQTGYEIESITPELRLLDDLNLDSIKAGEVIAEAAKQHGVAGLIDPTTLANATLLEIAEAIGSTLPEDAAGKPPVQAPVAPKQGFPSTSSVVRQQLVRDYVIQSTLEPTPAAVQGNQLIEDWPVANALVLYDRGNQRLSESLVRQLQELGAKAQQALFEYPLDQNRLQSPDFTHFILLLPSNSAVALPSATVVTTMVDRLRSIATPPQVADLPRQHTTVAYIQFGGGHFATRAPINSVEQCCTLGFAASLHLERNDLKVRALDFAPTIEAQPFAEKVVLELTTAHPYTTVGYDRSLTRYVPRPQVQDPIDYTDREIAWSSDDVIVVTGGGKGITAECAFSLAKREGVKMALVGRSPLKGSPSPQSPSEINRTLHRFESQGLICQYYACDVVDSVAVNQLIQQVEQDLGPVTGLIHGAAVNQPRLIESVSTEAAIAEISPKLLGLINLLEAFSNKPLKLLAAFSSVIGFTGMQRNGWYAFSNEALEILLRQYQSTHTDVSVVAMAYSVWDEVGMGARMGSVRSLNKMGISAIPKAEGVNRFLNLIRRKPKDLRVITAAPMQTLSAFENGGFDTWYPGLFSPPPASKFLEKILIYQPHVEVVSRVHLTTEHDTYLCDHIYKGSYLFPTVFGLESMAQAVAYVMNIPTLNSIQIEDIRLERPIVVSSEQGTTIEIYAEVLDRKTKEAPKRVRASIKTEQTGFAIEHFSATFVLDDATEMPLAIYPLPTQPLAIDPKTDLYSWLLFQGPRFQRLHKIFSLNDQQCLFQVNRQAEVPQAVSEDRADGPFLLGDPYCRDSLLQAGQLVIPQLLCLPVHIEKIELNRLDRSVEGLMTAMITSQAQQADSYYSDVFLTDGAGNVLEKLSGYQAKVLDRRPDNPSAADLAEPNQQDKEKIQQILSRCSAQFQITPPALSLAYLPGMHGLSTDERHQKELPIFQQAIEQLLTESTISTPHIKWTPSGKPFVDNYRHDIDISLAHDSGLCLAVAGFSSQGCDIEPIVHRQQADWIGLLSSARGELMEELMAKGDSADMAGTRIWSAIEAAQKASGKLQVALTIEHAEAKSVLFSYKGADDLKILTFAIKTIRRPTRMVAVTVSPANVLAVAASK
jgi:enediyne polyketide synthase